MTTTVNISQASLAEYERVYQVFDANGDGVLTRTEIVEALEVLGKGITSKDRQNLLNRINERNFVTHDNFIEWMAQREDIRHLPKTIKPW